MYCFALLEVAMTDIDITLSLPDELIGEANKQGLLTAQALEQLIRAELGRRKHRRLSELLDQVSAIPDAPMSTQEINAEIAATRAERRSRHAAGT